MHLRKYSAIVAEDHCNYEFLSSGPQGTIRKVVNFIEIYPNIYNLSFGDWDENEQKVSDKSRSNNHDRDIVLATVASIVIDFMEFHPNALVFAKGQTPSKTRLYQMGINSSWHEISQLYDVEGHINGKWEPFNNKKNYEAFILKAK